ncbi:MAG: hypothetical protein FVQ81_02380 [Candidatus Glassbacteria bacterium]|nr:hypothetical protein [Candidatus Glassbacteria bacterium]
MVQKVFSETDIILRVGSSLRSSDETLLNYLVLAPSAEGGEQTIRWDGTVRISPRLTIAADEHASINLREFYGDEDRIPPQLRELAIVFRSAYLKLDGRGVERQHIPRNMLESLDMMKNLFDRITSHRSRELNDENNALIVAPSEFVWPVSVLKYISEVMGEDFRSFRRFGP